MCINKPCSVKVCIIKHQNLSVKCPFFTFDNVNLWFVNAIDSFVNVKNPIKKDFLQTKQRKITKVIILTFLFFPSFSLFQSLFPIPWWRPSGHIHSISIIPFQSVMATTFKSQRASKINMMSMRPWLGRFDQAWPQTFSISFSFHWSPNRPSHTDDEEEEEVPCSLSLSLSVDDDIAGFQVTAISMINTICRGFSLQSLPQTQIFNTQSMPDKAW